MARRVEKITIDAPATPEVAAQIVDGKVVAPTQPARPEGRDHGKVFILTEMPATKAEPWATRALELLADAGTEVPAGTEGMAGLASVMSKGLAELKSLRALQDPSLDAWWDCVQYQHDPRQKPMFIIHDDGCQIEDISTITFLRAKVLELHIGFFSAGRPSTLV